MISRKRLSVHLVRKNDVAVGANRLLDGNGRLVALAGDVHVEADKGDVLGAFWVVFLQARGQQNVAQFGAAPSSGADGAALPRQTSDRRQSFALGRHHLRPAVSAALQRHRHAVLRQRFDVVERERPLLKVAEQLQLVRRVLDSGDGEVVALEVQVGGRHIVLLEYCHGRLRVEGCLSPNDQARIPLWFVGIHVRSSCLLDLILRQVTNTVFLQELPGFCGFVHCVHSPVWRYAAAGSQQDFVAAGMHGHKLGDIVNAVFVGHPDAPRFSAGVLCHL
mmetsp:Transcript_15693/g.27841  ORF Transcript_15693/g.27841 Transcript_15693/m.27841 type:complete len:277 (+) Transcript_15693:349-1179(+)